MLLSILAFTIEAVGGPSKPLEQPINTGQLYEVAPLISEIESVFGENTIEIYIRGWAESTCHDKQNIKVNTEDSNETKIVLRLQKSDPKPNSPCVKPETEFRIKVADLAINQKNSYLIKVLGHRGWHKKDLRYRYHAETGVKSDESLDNF